MGKISYTLTLTSDAEPGSGFGTELINQLVPRNSDGCPIIPATHIKGIARENITSAISVLNYSNALSIIDQLFGREGSENVDTSSSLYFSDLIPTGDATTTLIARTSVNEYGTAEEGSLRTSEAIACATQFWGYVKFDNNLVEPAEHILKLALLSVFSIGSNRTRGSGACYITIENEARSPGQILRELSETPLPISVRKNISERPFDLEKSERTVTLKVIFTSESTVCVPERPSVANNVISSGFAIPASAVQGAILYKMSELSSEAASFCFESKEFRTWPLLPSTDEAVLPSRVSTTHKISKLPDENHQYTIIDSMIDSYDWRNVPKSAPLQGTNGILLPNKDGVFLWLSADMPRLLTVHGVQNGASRRRNLFTVESIAHRLFVGMVTMPEKAAEIFEASIEKNPFVQIGHARSVRGGGKLKIERCDMNEIIKRSLGNSEILDRLFIVQSPVSVPSVKRSDCADGLLRKIVESSGWGEVEQAKASMSVLFGWNRHKKGNQYGQNGRLKARTVIDAGSVFLLKSKPEQVSGLMIRGVGDGKEQGLGAVLPHPGVARDKYIGSPSLRRVKAGNGAAAIAYKLMNESPGISPSQISTVKEKIDLDKNAALEFLKRQKAERPTRIGDRWESVWGELTSLVVSNPVLASEALGIWRNLAVSTEE